VELNDTVAALAARVSQSVVQVLVTTCVVSMR